MKHAVIILITILTLGVSCGTPGGRQPAGPLIQLEQRSDGLTYKKGDPGPYTGQLTMTVTGTNEKYVTHFQDGVRHGLLAVWYANGKHKANAEFNRGKLVSGITWKPDGTEGSRVMNGMGTFLMFHPDGSKARESVYKHGVRVRRTDFPLAGSNKDQ
ncbi:MAG: hypothetical protein CMJ62_21495 [Planctomycetaceae bacterium]|jgi:antitoxin component YwqK of YwqJK toxin-antitoxin module|nr:hypothetical protein [Planctomycetaceae bacterium]|tara:strand:+ start:1305 stop:1775 length:471 start_codon:yes stop_codon:yes gene_type:complete